MNRDDRFLKRSYYKNLFPFIFSILGGTVNTLIDSVFVSQRMGSDGLAAVNMCMPFYFVLCMFGSLVSAGAALLSAQAVGREKMDEAAAHYHDALTICVVAGALITVVGVLLCAPLAGILSQGGSLRQYVYDYSLVTIAGTLPLMLSYLPQKYLQLEGKMQAIVNTMFLMIALDVFFDWLFLFRFSLGMRGAALASLIATVLAGAYSFAALETGYTNYPIRLRRTSLQELCEIVRFGSPMALGNLLDSAKLFLLNMIILYVGGLGAAAVWAVLNTLLELSMALTSGVPHAASPMMGAYCASRENSGLRILMRLQIRCGLALTTLFALAPLFAHRPLARVFDVSDNLLLPFLCVGAYVILDLPSSAWITFFHAAGRIGLSNFMVICRKFLAPVAAALAVAALGAPIWFFLPLGGALALLLQLLAVCFCRRGQTEGVHALSPMLLLDDCLEREKKVLDFSIVANNENICTASEQIKDFCAENSMDPKQTMRLELAIEELLTVIAQREPNLRSVDLRAFALDETTGIRIRCAGKRYNPFGPHSKEEDEAMMGVELLKKMARDIDFVYSLGMNVILISFDKKKAEGT